MTFAIVDYCKAGPIRKAVAIVCFQGDTVEGLGFEPVKVSTTLPTPRVLTPRANISPIASSSSARRRLYLSKTWAWNP